MPRQTREELEAEILNCAAMLFASHGFKETSVQRIADAVGYSKAGLLHRYPSKEALQDAVIARCIAEMAQVHASVADREPGPDRDHEVIGALARLAMRWPGFVALLLSPLSTVEPGEVAERTRTIGELVFASFAIAPDGDPARRIRVVGALGALAVVCLALHGDTLSLDGAATPESTTALLVAMSYDALGHPSAR